MFNMPRCQQETYCIMPDGKEIKMSAESAVVVQTILSELEELPDEKLAEVLDFVRFLRVRYQINAKRYAPRVVNEQRWAELYAESAQEDSELAEAGIKEYDTMLKSEDTNAKG